MGGTASAKALGSERAWYVHDVVQCGWRGEKWEKAWERRGPAPQGIVGQVFGSYPKPWEAAGGFYAEERLPLGCVWELDRGA